MRRVALLLLVPLFLASPARAQVFDSSPTEAVVYKNGLSWVVEEGRGETENEWVVTRIHGLPVVGTVRPEGGGETEVLEVTALPGSGDAGMRTLLALEDKLKGKPLFLTTGERGYTGTFLGVTSGAFGGGEPMVALEGKDGTTYIPLRKVERFDSSLGSGDVPSARRTGDAELRLRLSRRQGPFHVRTAYMTQGLGWLPTYHLDIGEKKGRLSLVALVVNDSLDLEAAEVRFATGEGTFPLRHTQSPLVSAGTRPEWVMDQVMGSVRGGLNLDWDNNNPAYNVMNLAPMQQMVAAGPGDGGSGRSSGEETHLYGPARLTLKKGERAAIPLGKGSVPAKFIYYYKAPQQVANAPEHNTVWLAAQLTNGLDFPLTTGPMLVTRKGLAVGQGFVTYTHKGGEALVPVSVASSVLASVAEHENDRDSGALTFRGGKYDKVEVKGTIAVENLQERPVSVRVEKPVSGKALGASHEGSSVEQFVSAYDPNPRSTFTWTVEVKAGEKVELSYRYDLFVQRYGKSSF